jgi:hypothetical protein
MAMAVPMVVTTTATPPTIRMGIEAAARMATGGNGWGATRMEEQGSYPGFSSPLPMLLGLSLDIPLPR